MPETTTDFFALRAQLRKAYIAPRSIARAEPIGEKGFLTEVNGRVLLTAPAGAYDSPPVGLPAIVTAQWQEYADSGNDHYLWLQGRYVEAEKANRNGAYWSTGDLQFGESSVRNSPLNWLHQEKSVIGTIVDNRLILPAEPDGTEQASTPGDLTAPLAQPFMATVAAVWKWVHPDKTHAIEHFAADGKLWMSMECIGRQIACVTDGDLQGCGESFDYMTAMTAPDKTCAHIASRSSARRIVDPTFLGGGIIVPPAAPGWGQADQQIMRQAASLAEQAYNPTAGLADGEWESLMAQVLAYASS